MIRRKFIQTSTVASLALSTGLLSSCQEKSKTEAATEKKQHMLDISLAQWSLNQSFFNKKLDVNDFASISKSVHDISAVEYVNQFYVDHATDEKFWNEMRSRADNVGVKSLLIMVDAEGDLGNLNDKDRNQAVQNHYKWVNAAKLLGCHSIRVNAFGEGGKEQVGTALEDGLGKLAEYSAKENINVLIENHGLYSSDGAWIAQLIKKVNTPYLGTLPDFGNWCTNIKWGSIHGEGCEAVYDIYQGVSDFMPFAKGVSAKAYNFNEDGEETSIDFAKMIALVKDAGFSGHIGVEYEGSTMSEVEGIRATKALIEKYI